MKWQRVPLAAMRQAMPSRHRAALSVTAPEPPEREQQRVRLDHAVNHLLRTEPALSSAHLLVGWQILICGMLAGALGQSLFTAPLATLSLLFAALALPFLCIVLLRVMALLTILVEPTHTSNDTPPLLGADEALPVYSVLVPLYEEAEVVPALIAALTAIDYPADRLEILLVVEHGDQQTRAALAGQHLPAHMRVVAVPEGEPRTKPRAINYALAGARGDFVVVYDAEDMPESDQLRRALAAFRAAGPDLGCVQARLNTYNPHETFFTRQFSIEYTALFDLILPALARLDLPVPLGGTSNHFPRHVLEAAGGWDPYNVTEDADLGNASLARAGASACWHRRPGRRRRKATVSGVASARAGSRAGCRPTSYTCASLCGCCANSAPSAFSLCRSLWPA